MATLAEIRAKLKEQDNKTANNQITGDNSIYPFWNIKEGETAILRFLPDGDTNNTFFWVERQMIRLQFNGIKGQPDSKPFTMQIPCMEMFNEPCPVLTEIRPWFNDASLEAVARKYWKKRSYIFQGIVVDDPLEGDKPENPIRRFIVGPQVFKVIKQALMDPDMDELPTDYIHGIDFRLNKSSDGSGFANYGTSNWARKERPLSDTEQTAINSFGLNVLSDFLPNKPTEEAIECIKEMFEASIDGEAFDPSRWGKHFRAPGMGSTNTSNSTDNDLEFEETKPVQQEPVQQEPVKQEPVKQEPVVTQPTAQGAQDILAMIRARQTQ